MSSLVTFFKDKLGVAQEECDIIFAICLTAALNSSIDLCVKGQPKTIVGWASLRRVLKKFCFAKVATSSLQL